MLLLFTFKINWSPFYLSLVLLTWYPTSKGHSSSSLTDWYFSVEAPSIGFQSSNTIFSSPTSKVSLPLFKEISMTTSHGNTRFPTKTRASFIIPLGCLILRSASCRVMLVWSRLPKFDNLFYIERGIRLILALKSHKESSTTKLPIEMRIEKLHGSSTLRGSFIKSTKLHSLEKFTTPSVFLWLVVWSFKNLAMDGISIAWRKGIFNYITLTNYRNFPHLFSNLALASLCENGTD